MNMHFLCFPSKLMFYGWFKQKSIALQRIIQLYLLYQQQQIVSKSAENILISIQMQPFDKL